MAEMEEVIKDMEELVAMVEYIQLKCKMASDIARKKLGRGADIDALHGICADIRCMASELKRFEAGDLKDRIHDIEMKLNDLDDGKWLMNQAEKKQIEWMQSFMREE